MENTELARFQFLESVESAVPKREPGLPTLGKAFEAGLVSSLTEKLATACKDNSGLCCQRRWEIEAKGAKLATANPRALGSRKALPETQVGLWTPEASRARIPTPKQTPCRSSRVF